MTRAPGARPDIVLVTLDTTRADRLGLYGYPRPTSPNLDRLAEESLVFERAVSTSSWTLPAHASMFTGRIPSSHGARTDPEGDLLLSDGLEEEGLPPYRASTLSDAEQTLAERLSDAGYATLGVAGGPWLKRVFGLAAGFEGYDESGVTTWHGARGDHVTDAALALLDEVGEEPVFLFVNYFDPHTPYDPPWRDRLAVLGKPLASLREGMGPTLLRSAYDGEIRAMDRQLGRLLEGLRARGRYAESLVVVTADHGELFGEGGHVGHGLRLSEAELRVPLIVRPPGGTSGEDRRAGRVSTTGLFALILDQAGLPIPDHAQPSVTAPLPGDIVAEVTPLAQQSKDGHWRALYLGNLKYLWNSEGHHELRDLSEEGDPTENRIDASPDLARRLDAKLARILAEAQPPDRSGDGERVVDEATREALENLGYLR